MSAKSKIGMFRWCQAWGFKTVGQKRTYEAVYIRITWEVAVGDWRRKCNNWKTVLGIMFWNSSNLRKAMKRAGHEKVNWSLFPVCFHSKNGKEARSQGQCFKKKRLIFRNLFDCDCDITDSAGWLEQAWGAATECLWGKSFRYNVKLCKISLCNLR
jgi:hypothetical protein